MIRVLRGDQGYEPGRVRSVVGPAPVEGESAVRFRPPAPRGSTDAWRGWRETGGQESQ